MKRYQIFISSTYTDLQVERQEVLKSVLKLRHIPVGMEHFVATNKEQFEYIKRLLDETDYYVIIIGNRYGSQADDGVSYTEKEFDYAVSLGIPVIACIHSNPDCQFAKKQSQYVYNNCSNICGGSYYIKNLHLKVMEISHIKMFLIFRKSFYANKKAVT